MDNIKASALPSGILSESWRPFTDYIYQHLVGVRLVLISNTGCDLKSTQAGLSPSDAIILSQLIS